MALFLNESSKEDFLSTTEVVLSNNAAEDALNNLLLLLLEIELLSTFHLVGYLCKVNSTFALNSTSKLAFSCAVDSTRQTRFRNA